MKAIIRFAVVFILTYALCLILFQSSIISRPIYHLLKGVCTSWISSLLPSADISSQLMSNNKSGNSSDIYIVYGNPILIQAAKEKAIQNKQQYATLPTKSMELHLFEMYIVPVFFLLSLFVATPSKSKIIGSLVGLFLLIFYILIKLFFLSLFEISNARIGIYELSDQSMRNLSTLLGVLSLGLTITLAFIVWLIFGFRKSVFADKFSSYFK